MRAGAPPPSANRARMRIGWPAIRRKSPGSTVSSAPEGDACSQAVRATRPSGVDPRETTATSAARASNPRRAARRSRVGATMRARSIPRRRAAASATTSSWKPPAGRAPSRAAALATRSSSSGHRSSTSRATRSSDGGRRNGHRARTANAADAASAAADTASNGTSGGEEELGPDDGQQAGDNASDGARQPVQPPGGQPTAPDAAQGDAQIRPGAVSHGTHCRTGAERRQPGGPRPDRHDTHAGLGRPRRIVPPDCVLLGLSHPGVWLPQSTEGEDNSNPRATGQSQEETGRRGRLKQP